MKRNHAGLLRDYRAMTDTSLGSPYHKRVLKLESEGLCTSDAQGVADVEFANRLAARRDQIDPVYPLVRSNPHETD
jgi:hypothetical protein